MMGVAQLLGPLPDVDAVPTAIGSGEVIRSSAINEGLCTRLNRAGRCVILIVRLR